MSEHIRMAVRPVVTVGLVATQITIALLAVTGVTDLETAKDASLLNGPMAGMAVGFWFNDRTHNGNGNG